MSLRKLIFLLILCVNSTHAQKDYGFYGSKFIVQTEGLINSPIFYNIVSIASGNINFKEENGKLTKSKDMFNYGYRFSLGYALKRNIAFLVELGQDFSNVYPEDYPIYYDFDSPRVTEHERLNTVSTSILPKFEFASSKSLLPMGLGHQVGFGIERTRVVDKDYRYTLDYYYLTDSSKVYSQSDSDLDPINFELIPKIKRYVLMYALSIRTPLTKHLLLNYGVRYSLRFGRAENQFIPTNYPDTKPIGNSGFTNDVIEKTARMRSLSIININVGLTYTF